jgi:hypothetical protein
VFDVEDFAMCGGESSAVSTTVTAGLADAPATEKMHVICSAESALRKPGTDFIFVVRAKRPEDHRFYM